ncbi:MAG: SEC-C metal-binding domain-containing protein [Candidatus Acidiferrales bacterium]
MTLPTHPPFVRSSKRRKGYPSETQVKRGTRVVHCEKELVEKLGRNDPCPCGSGRKFQALLPPNQSLRWQQSRLFLLENRRSFHRAANRLSYGRTFLDSSRRRFGKARPSKRAPCARFHQSIR